MNKIQIIQGGQYGSEAKGAIAAHLCKVEDIDIAVRTGATNAGHTVYYEGQEVKMQQLPVGWVNPKTHLVLGPGTLIDPVILRREINTVGMLTGQSVLDRLHIDHRATWHRPDSAVASKVSDRHHMIGATGKGCSEAIMDRIRLRGVQELQLSKLKDYQDLPFEDTTRYLNRSYDTGAKIQLEGTQGTLLDLYTGPWPYVTHKQTGPGVWLSEAGLSPALPLDIVMVVRTMPIRVAGNSGPLPNETSWLDLAKSINTKRDFVGLGPIVQPWALEEFYAALTQVGEARRDKNAMPIGGHIHHMHTWSEDMRLFYRDTVSEAHKEAFDLLPNGTVDELRKFFELTTVTRKLRRIAHLNVGKLAEAAMLVRPHRVAVTFLNYIFPEYWGDNGDLRKEEVDFLKGIEAICHAPVTIFNRGPLAHNIRGVVR